MRTARSEFLAGVRATAPVQLGILPFAIVSGIAAKTAGLSPLLALGMSWIVFAGSAQLVALQLIQKNAAAWVILLSTAIVNLRFVMYSASLAPFLKPVSLRWKALLAYLLTDQAYALAISHYDADGPDATAHKHWYLFGAAVSFWTVWQIGTVVGIALGKSIDASWSLDFAIPLTFLALLFPAIKDRPAAFAALTAGTIAVAAHGLPSRLGLIVATVLGVSIGLALERKRL